MQAGWQLMRRPRSQLDRFRRSLWYTIILLASVLAESMSQYLIANLGISPNFEAPDFTALTFPTTMKIDWIRVYQPKNAINVGCDPKDFPTAAYITE